MQRIKYLQLPLYLAAALCSVLWGCQTSNSNSSLQTATPLAESKLECGDDLLRFLQFPSTVTPQHTQMEKKQKRLEVAFFQASCSWSEVSNWQNTSPQPSNPKDNKEPLNLPHKMNIALSASKPQDAAGPSIRLLVYEQLYNGMPNAYLENIRLDWQKTGSTREIDSPTLRSLGSFNKYGYLLHFMSAEYLYQEFILFVQNRAVHFIFQSPHEMLENPSSLESFYLHVNKELEQGLFFRKQKVLKPYY